MQFVFVAVLVQVERHFIFHGVHCPEKHMAAARGNLRNKNSGGRRPGAGRPKKPLADKILEGKTGAKKLPQSPQTEPSEIPEPRDYITATQRQGELIAAEIRQELWNWLCERNCSSLVSMLVIDMFSMSYARWVQLQQALSEYGFLSKHPTVGTPISSPFATLALNESKQVLMLWNTIYSVVKENCADHLSDTGDDVMERLLAGKV